MNKKTIIGGLVLIVIVFYSGMMYGQSKTTTPQQDFKTGNFVMGQNGIRGGVRAGGGMVVGEIILKDTLGVTIKLQNGGSKIVLISKSTPVTKTVSGTLADLVVGQQINANGITNTDGSITAESIQIRQATTTRQ